MSHARQHIREAAATLLTGLTTTAARVYQSRLRPLTAAELPCLLINTDDEQIETLGVNEHATQERNLQISIRCIAKLASNIDDALDTMMAEVETAMADQTFGNKVKSLQLTGIRIEMNDDLDQPVGVASATYQATYYTATGTPGTAL